MADEMLLKDGTCQHQWTDGWAHHHFCFLPKDGEHLQHLCVCDSQAPYESRVHDHGPDQGPGVQCPERVLRNGQKRGACLTDAGLSRG